MAGYVNVFASDAYYRAGEPEQALGRARHAEEISRTLGEFTNIVAAMNMAFGFAHLAAGRADDSAAAFRAALEAYGRVERQSEGWDAVCLAEALLLGGDLSAAHEAAEDAIALFERTQRDPYEAQAHGVIARALLRRDGRSACKVAEAALARAASLIERSGATTLSPALCEWRAELAAVLGDDAGRDRLLREAQQGYEKIGAPRHAARLAQDNGV